MSNCCQSLGYQWSLSTRRAFSLLDVRFSVLANTELVYRNSQATVDCRDTKQDPRAASDSNVFDTSDVFHKTTKQCLPYHDRETVLSSSRRQNNVFLTTTTHQVSCRTNRNTAWFRDASPRRRTTATQSSSRCDSPNKLKFIARDSQRRGVLMLGLLTRVGDPACAHLLRVVGAHCTPALGCCAGFDCRKWRFSCAMLLEDEPRYHHSTGCQAGLV